MKKGIKTTLLLIVFILFTTLNVYAADIAEDPTSNGTEVTLTPSYTQAKVGDTVTIIVSAKCDSGIEGVDATLEYAETKLEFINQEQVAATGFTSMSGIDEETQKFQLSVVFTGSGEAPTEANFATLSFKVLDGVNVDEDLSIKLTGIEVGDSNDDWTSVKDKEVILTVVENEEEPGEGEENQDNGEQNPSEEQDTSEGEQKPSEEQKTDDTIAKSQ